MKKRLLLSSICVSLFAVIASCIFVNNNLNVHADDNCEWNHYLRTEPTYESCGNKEYWICCTHHDYSLVKPTTGTGQNKAGVAVSQSTLAQIELRKDDTNSPYIPSYKTPVDEVTSLISSLPEKGDLKPYHLNTIQTAYTKYNALEDAAKKYVTNYSKLTSLNSAYNEDYGVVLDLSSNQLSTTGCAGSWSSGFTQEVFTDNTYGKGRTISTTSALSAYEFAYSNASDVSSYKYIALYVYAPSELHFFISRQNWRNNVMNVSAAPDITGSVSSDIANANKTEANSVQDFGLSVGWHEIIFDASRFSTSGFIEIWGSSSKTAKAALSGWKISNFYGIKESYDVKKVNSLISKLPTETSNVSSLTASTIEGIDALYNGLSSSAKNSVVGYDSFATIRTYVNANYINITDSYSNGYKTNIFAQEIEDKPYVDSKYGAMSKLTVYHTQSSYEHCGIKPNSVAFSEISSLDYVSVNVYNPLSFNVTASLVNGSYGYLTSYTLTSKSWTELRATPAQLSEGIANAYILIYSSSPISSDDWLVSSIYGFGSNPGQAVAKLINNLATADELKIEDYDQIINVKRSYDNLSETYKAFVTNYSVLTDLIAVYNDDFGYISSGTSFISKGSFDYAHTKDFGASIVDNQSDSYYGKYSQINFEDFTEFKSYTSGDTWGYTPCVKLTPTPVEKTYNNLMFYIYNPTSSNQNIYLYKGYWVAANARFKNDVDQNESTSTNTVTLKSGWNRVVIDDVSSVDFNNFVIGFIGKGNGTCESGWKITSLRGEIVHSFSGNY